MKNYFIKKYQPTDYHLWNEFVANAKNATFLFHRDFMEYHSDRYEDFSLLIFDEKNHLKSIENGLTKLSYSDNGVWIEKQVDGFGTELLLVLSDQLDGKMSRKSSTTEIEFNFSEE